MVVGASADGGSGRPGMNLVANPAGNRRNLGTILDDIDVAAADGRSVIIGANNIVGTAGDCRDNGICADAVGSATANRGIIRAALDDVTTAATDCAQQNSVLNCIIVLDHAGKVFGSDGVWGWSNW